LGAFLLLIFPMLGFTQSGVQLFADRFTYLAAVPFSILLGAGLSRLKIMRRTVCGALAALLTVFGAQSFVFSNIWSDGLALWHYAIVLDVNNALAWSNAGLSLMECQQYEKALKCFDRAIQIDEGFGLARHNRALTMAQLGRYQEAMDEWKTAMSLPRNSKQDVGKMLLARGWVFGQVGDIEAAERDYSAVADDSEITPIRRLQALQLRAVIFIQTGRREKAEADLMKMLTLPNIGDGYQEKARLILTRLKKIPGE
jgi:tetratricopeptide (TPR) repeat protein